LQWQGDESTSHTESGTVKNNARKIGPEFLSPWEIDFFAPCARITRNKLRAMAQAKTAIISIENLKDNNLPSLRHALQAVPGVENIDFSLKRSVAVIDFDPSQSHIDDFLRAILKAGFKVL
jgi:hypothetical protein